MLKFAPNLSGLVRQLTGHGEDGTCEGMTTRGQDVVEGTTWKNKEICEARRVQQKFLIPEDKVLKVTDEQGIEVDEDVFPELATESVCFVISIDDVIPLAESSKNMAECSDPTEFADCSNLTEFVTFDLTLLQQGEGSSSSSLTDSMSLSSSLSSLAVEQILTSKPAGMTVIKEYEETRSLKDSTRRLMVNIIVAHMREKEGRFVNKTTKEFHALGIVSLFPSLKDPYSKKGYEHFYDIQRNKGFLEWRVKTVQQWDSDMASFLVLLHLLTPQPAGRKRPKKISACQSLEDHLKSTEGHPQPYLLASGTSKAQVSSFYIVLDRKLLPCQSCTSLGEFDELFKSHFVFSVKYDDALASLYTFLQTTLYNIDIGTTEETPRVKELRAKLLNKQ
ncbi:uncharacterized protein AB9X84_005521 [Acanthopagrus schlegelii]